MSAAGMAAVARVREVRERDSRLGLAQAIAEQQALVDRAAQQRAELAGATPFASGTGADFRHRHAVLTALGQAVTATEAAAASATTLTTAAQARWVDDRARLAAVELLIERRAAERRAEVARAEARELDDVASLRWLRQRSQRTQEETR